MSVIQYQVFLFLWDSRKMSVPVCCKLKFKINVLFKRLLVNYMTTDLINCSLGHDENDLLLKNF